MVLNVNCLYFPKKKTINYSELLRNNIIIITPCIMQLNFNIMMMTNCVNILLLVYTTLRVVAYYIHDILRHMLLSNLR